MTLTYFKKVKFIFIPKQIADKIVAIKGSRTIALIVISLERNKKRGNFLE